MSQHVDDDAPGVTISAAVPTAAIAADLTHVVHSRIAAHHNRVEACRGLRLLGRGLPEIMEALTRLEPLARRSVWGMQPTMRFDPDDTTHKLNQRSAQRGLKMHAMTSAHALTVNPLLPSLNPQLRVAPVAIACILIDEAAAILPGPLDSRGRPTAWLVTDPTIVEMSRAMWDATWAASTPVGDHRHGPLTRRQIEVARGLVKGVKDTTLARHLEVSPRTVVADVSHLLDFLGAGSRAEAVFILGGGALHQR